MVQNLLQLLVVSVRVLLPIVLNSDLGFLASLDDFSWATIIDLDLALQRVAAESKTISFSRQGPTNKSFQLQPHPNIDKELLKSKTQIALKNPSKPFPTNTDVGVLKWRFTTQDETFIPLSSK